MCGRFTHRLPWSEIHRMYNLTRQRDIGRNTRPRYNIAPTQDVVFVRLDDDGRQVVEEGRWWLVPSWAKEAPKYAMFNARIETAAQKPAFRDAFKARRCLIPADGYFEWTKAADGEKDPWYIHLPKMQPFSFAGLWARNDRLDVTSCTIVTAPAIAPVDEVHTRMPVILDRAAYDGWLDPATPAEAATDLLNGSNLDATLEFYRVGRQVNSSRYQGEDTIEPIADPA